MIIRDDEIEPVMKLRSQMIEFWENLRFEEEFHRYFVKIDERTTVRIPSVSRLIYELIAYKDWDAIAGEKAIRDGVTKESLLAEWKHKSDTALVRGKATHHFAEVEIGEREATTEQEKAVVKFWKELEKSNPGRYVIINKEKIMYHKEFMYSGTADILLYDTITNTIVIGDYKTNADLFKNFKSETLLKPFDDYLETDFNKYQIQLCLYQILIEQLGIPVSQRWIIWVTPEGNYQKFQGQDLTRQLSRWVRTLPMNALLS